MARLSAILAMILVGMLAVSPVHGWPFLGRSEHGQKPPQHRIRVAVLDFSVAPRVVERRDEHRRLRYSEKEVETEKDIRGWWFGSNDVYYNANIGRIAADIFDEQLRSVPGLDVYSRQDLRVFYAEKKQKIRKRLSIDERSAARALEQLDPIAVGRELGVDKVVVGRICDAELRKNRTFGPFASVTSLNVSLYDVHSGRIELSRSYATHANFTSVYANIEGRAKKFARDIQRLLAESE